ncbi:MAG: helix-hairpin-helix domain-containing protein [Sporolactobacillus sp.]
MKKRLQSKKGWIAAAAVLAGLIILFFYFSTQSAEKRAAAVRAEQVLARTSSSAPQIKKPSSPAVKASGVVVDVKGAVNRPGVYHLSAGSRVGDAIEQAGGVAGGGDTRQVNFAQKLSDEMMVYVPHAGETQPAAAASSVGETDSSSSAKVNVNTAGEQQLQNLPGIGPAKAKAILQYRQTHGSFRTLDDLGNVSGIGEKILERIKPAATVE